MTFDLAVFDAGVPQKSAMAKVTVNIGNLNDESPVFEQPEGNFWKGKILHEILIIPNDFTIILVSSKFTISKHLREKN